MVMLERFGSLGTMWKRTSLRSSRSALVSMSRWVMKDAAAVLSRPYWKIRSLAFETLRFYHPTAIKVSHECETVKSEMKDKISPSKGSLNTGFYTPDSL